MKVELILSSTYVCGGKVYNKGIAYEVDKKIGRHLLAQSNERNVPYFRKAADEAQAHIAPKKSIDKGGVPLPVDDEDEDETKVDGPETDPDPADDDGASAVGADGEPVDDDDADEDEGEDDADADEEAITV